MEKIKIDLIDKKILSELDKNSRISATQLGKKVKRSREAVKYRIQQLVNKGIITGFITSINPNILGYYMFKVYLKLENISAEREKFFHELKNNKDIYWYGICDGAFDCVFAIVSKSTTEYFEKVNLLFSKWKHLIISKVLGTMVDTRQYNKKFFLNETSGDSVIFGGETLNYKMDELDSKILFVLTNSARIPLLQLARKVNSSIEIVRGRIKKLEQKKIILGYRIAVDLNKLGLEFFKAIIYFKTLTKKDEKAMFEWMRNHPNSLYYIRSLAPWEVEFEFAVENYLHFNKIINELRQLFPHVIRNHEHLIMSYESWLPAHH
ncbi:Lrp/AsnC family transcriptional regulator [Candidatus Woesearchaeota archaeon]|nr:Lrp/AsnC family transcriptional regulator [Candidatus Woesearchaeota archaeon]